MLLCDLTAPYKRLPVYDYAGDHTTAELRMRELQHISGTAYRGRNKTDKYGNVHCRIYVYYPELNAGMWVYGLGHPDQRRIDEVERSFHKRRLETVEQFIADLEYRLQECMFIGNAEIALARIAAPDRAEAFAEGRLAYRYRKAEEAAAWHAKCEAEDAAFCSEHNAVFEDAVKTAIETIRNGGSLENRTVTHYRSRFDSSTYRIVNHLARQYQVQIPLKVQGWINHQLIGVKISGDGLGSYTYKKGHPSDTFPRYMRALIRAVRADEAEKSTEPMEASA